MLELIVLGMIPGTTIQITFYQIVFLILSGIAIAGLFYYRAGNRYSPGTMISGQLALKNPPTARYFGRKAATLRASIFVRLTNFYL